MKLDAYPDDLFELRSLADRMGSHSAAVKVYLADKGAAVPETWNSDKMMGAASRYYVDGPSTSECQYLLERAWLSAAVAQCTDLDLRFPHVERVVRS